jgi:hypothetical protein
MPNLRIYLKKKASSEKLNKVLAKMGINYSFNTEKFNKEWLDDINTNPEAHQRHLKPEGRDYTMEELMKLFPDYTKVGFMNIDLSFGRCEDDQMMKLGDFILSQKDSIRFIKGGLDLLERSEIQDDKVYKAIDDLNRLPLPKLKKPKKMRQQMPTGGQMLAKTWGPEGSKVWLIFGGVDKDQPIFLKTDEYVRKEYNSLHKDKEGRAFLLMPQYDFSEDFAETVSEAAQKMSIREHPNYLLCGLYSNIFGIDKDQIKYMAGVFSEFYTKDELIERLEEQACSAVISFGMSYNGIGYNGEGFKSIGGHHQRLVNFLNTLHMALSLYSVKDAQLAASKAYERFNKTA